MHFKFGDNRGKIKPEAKALGLLLYGSGKASYGMIARLFNVSRSAVLYWIRSMGSRLPEPVIEPEIAEVSIIIIYSYISLIKHSHKFYLFVCHMYVLSGKYPIAGTTPEKNQ